MKNKALDANLDFDGMAGNGVNRAKNRYAGNQSGQTMKENYAKTINKGNASSSPMAVGPSATKDKHAMTIATASQGGKINGGATVKQFGGSPDKINVGMK